MDYEIMITFLNRLYMVNDIPLCVFRNGELTLQLPVITYFATRIQKYIDVLKQQQTRIAYLMTEYDAFYGLIRLDGDDFRTVDQKKGSVSKTASGSSRLIVSDDMQDEVYIFVGPFFTTSITNEELDQILKMIQLPDYAVPDAKAFLQYVPTGSLSKFLCYLTSIYTAVTHQLIDIEEVIYNEAFNNSKIEIEKTIANSLYKDKEKNSPTRHSTFLHELYRVELIINGDVVGMKKNTQCMIPGNRGQIGSNALRQAKNIFISGCTLYTRAAILGGMDIEEAYTLSDTYINTSEACTTVSEVERLHLQMPLDFAIRVEQASKLNGKSAPIVDAIHYIEENINQPIQASDIAEHVNLSTSYFLKKFKSELGVGVSEYITKAKIREACMLLKYTDKSLTEISNYLYFSSQSYFQNVFKKQMNITPNQYRNNKPLPVAFQRSKAN